VEYFQRGAKPGALAVIQCRESEYVSMKLLSDLVIVVVLLVPLWLLARAVFNGTLKATPMPPRHTTTMNRIPK